MGGGVWIRLGALRDQGLIQLTGYAAAFPSYVVEWVSPVGSVIKKRRKRMAKKKHRKLLKKTRVQRRNKK